ncbi:acyltransferase domain-containing protein [Auraticoccus monumenti]|uniref:acyltransferase domain-containing protein n=1 Tax=Auraticoccus monumenti TaxID=675864 RepID=UPI000B810D26|nr:acyltransferase domain-containing protein [Auraticoccus monumenti]
MAATTIEIAPRLSGWDAAALADRLGLRPDDAAETAVLLEELRGDDAAGERLTPLVAALVDGVGDFRSDAPPVFGLTPDGSDHRSSALGRTVTGGLAVAALVAATPEVLAFHAAHGIDEEQGWRSLSDLGQQMWVHRRTYGDLGLHTEGWLTCAWSGALHWLGRLQLNLRPLTDDEGVEHPARWQLSVHIPEAGPLDPAAVDDSLRRAAAFFAVHHPDHPAEELHCSSWLLDPTLAEELPGSNLAGFQQRWRLNGRTHPGNEDALFFTFRRRGEVDLTALPQDTRLQRLVVRHITEGPGWVSAEGTAPLPSEEAR